MDKSTTCCFTGHRPDKLPWGEDETDPRCLALKQRLAAALDWDRQQKRPVLRVGGRAISSGRDHLSEYLGP